MRQDRITPEMVRVAKEWSQYFTRKKRPNADDDGIVTLKNDRPEVLYDAARAAHGDMLPDDFRYEMIEGAVDAIAEASEGADVSDVSHEFADQAVSIWNSERTKWLASHSSRPGYVDDAVSNFGDSGDVLKNIGYGWYAEAEEVFASIAASIKEEAETRWDLHDEEEGES